MMAHDKNKKLEVSIVNSSITVDSKVASCNLRLLFTNRTDTAFLLYGFVDFESWKGHESLFKENDVTVGLVFFIASANGKKSLPLNSSEWKNRDNKFTYTYDNLLKDIKENNLVVPKNKSIEKTIKLEFVKERIQKGNYKMYLVYYCGKNITNLIDEKEIKNDEIINRALVYQGYAKSNTVNLNVK
jgi:hypothetical protein